MVSVSAREREPIALRFKRAEAGKGKQNGHDSYSDTLRKARAYKRPLRAIVKHIPDQCSLRRRSLFRKMYISRSSL
jgi:hypothetical protein